MNNKYPNVTNLLINSRNKSSRGQRSVNKALGYKDNLGSAYSSVERGFCSIPEHKLKDYSTVLDIDVNELKDAWLKDYRLKLDRIME